MRKRVQDGSCDVVALHGWQQQAEIFSTKSPQYLPLWWKHLPLLTLLQGIVLVRGWGCRNTAVFAIWVKEHWFAESPIYMCVCICCGSGRPEGQDTLIRPNGVTGLQVIVPLPSITSRESRLTGGGSAARSAQLRPPDKSCEGKTWQETFHTSSIASKADEQCAICSVSTWWDLTLSLWKTDLIYPFRRLRKTWEGIRNVQHPNRVYEVVVTHPN